MIKDLVLIGMPGCGKTGLGKRLAREIGRPFLDLDAEIQKTEDKTIKEIFAECGESGFRRTETEVFRRSMGGGRVIATGGGIVTVEENHEIAKGGTVIFIDRPLERILSDVNTGTRPLLAQGKERLYSLYDERYNLYMDWADIRIINDDTIREAVDRIKKEVKEYENNGD